MDDKLKKLEAERDEYLNGWKRAKADLINYQKDEQKRFEEIVKFSVQDFIKDLVAVLDSFDLALATLEKSAAAEKAENGSTQLTMKGVYMIRAQIEDVMKKRGVERLPDTVGSQFDPALHEAVAQAESDKPEGTVIEEIERGYLLHGKVVRPARVKVATSNKKQDTSKK